MISINVLLDENGAGLLSQVKLVFVGQLIQQRHDSLGYVRSTLAVLGHPESRHVGQLIRLCQGSVAQRSY